MHFVIALARSRRRLLVLTSAPCRDLFSSLSLVTNLITTWGDACPARGNNMFSVTFRGNGACSLRGKFGVGCNEGQIYLRKGCSPLESRNLTKVAFCWKIRRNLP